MPGSRRGEKKISVVQLRVAETDLVRWKKHATERGGYLSVLIRRAVDEYLTRNPNVRAAPRLDVWPERSRRY